MILLQSPTKQIEAVKAFYFHVVEEVLIRLTVSA